VSAVIARLVGRYAEIVYQDGRGRLSQRIVFVRSVRDDVVRAFCTERGAPRTFSARGILACRPVFPAGRRAMPGWSPFLARPPGGGRTGA